MTIFYQIILKAINDYKAILRRNLAAPECAEKIRKLGIKRAYIKDSDEVKLYEIGLKIIDNLEQHMSSSNSKRGKSVNFYYGSEEFLQYLKKILTEYIVEDNKVINASQKSSCALVSAIQLINKTNGELTEDTAEKIHGYVRIIAKHGNKEQKAIFNNIISSNKLLQMNFFFRQMKNFMSTSCIGK